MKPTKVICEPVHFARAREVQGWPEVVARLKAGEALKIGFTFNHKAFFANGDIVPDRLMRAHRVELLQDANGNVTLEDSTA